MRTKATYGTAIAYGRFHSWHCGRVLNNRGTLIVIQLGPKLWRCDTKLLTTVGALEADGWHKMKPQKWGR